MATAFKLEHFVAAPPLEQAEAVARGLPAAAVRDLVADRVVSLADVARIVGPRRTIDRRLKENERLSPDESDRLARFINILHLATSIFGSKAVAMRWLGGAKLRFDGKTPLELVKSDAGTRLVEEILLQARHGMSA